MIDNEIRYLLSNINSKLIKFLPVNEDSKSIYIRKVKKFRKHPIASLSDSLKKNSYQIRKKIPIKYKISNSFTIVSAVYNIEQYLNDYFESLINQTVDFRKHIKLVLVDDGSTDSSAEIIRKWQKIYPNNIIYVYKENGGQASARNLGLKHVETKWVTFIDPDDRIEINFFYHMERAIKKSKNPKILSSYIKLLSNNGLDIKDKHPLRYKFTNNIVSFTVNDVNSYINLSAASSIFDYEVIYDNKLFFDERLKVSFEDAKFIFNYISCIEEGVFLYVAKSVYLYRKHANSTISKSWIDKRKYIDTFKYGYLESLKLGENKTIFKDFIKNTVLYDISNYLKFLLNKDSFLDFLETDLAEFHSLLLLTIKQIGNKELILKSNIDYISKAFILYYLEQGTKKSNILFAIDNNHGYNSHFLFSDEDLLLEFLNKNIEVINKFNIYSHSFGYDKLTFVDINSSDFLNISIKF